MKYGTVVYFKHALSQFLPYGADALNNSFILSMRVTLKDDNVEHAQNLMSAYDELVKPEDD